MSKPKKEETAPVHIMCGSQACDWAGTWGQTDERFKPGDPITTEVCPKCGCDHFLEVQP